MRPSRTPRQAVIFPREVLTRLWIARSSKLPRETGGFLIGMRREPHIEITGSTLEGVSDRSTPFSFERIDEHHGRAVDAAWRAGNERVTMVGDWHSHPYGDGRPSNTDRKAWRSLCANSAADCVGLILGGTAIPRLFLVRNKGLFGQVKECRLVADEGEDLVFGVDP